MIRMFAQSKSMVRLIRSLLSIQVVVSFERGCDVPAVDRPKAMTRPSLGPSSSSPVTASRFLKSRGTTGVSLSGQF